MSEASSDSTAGAVVNPHTLVSESRLSSPSAGTLFSDGLTSIFAYCQDREWRQAAMTSKYWFSVASGCRSREIFHRIAEIDQKESRKEYIRSGRNTEHQHQQAQSPPSSGRWSLRHHITHIVMLETKWADFGVQITPSTTSLSSPPPAPADSLSTSTSYYPSLRQLRVSLALPPHILQMRTSGIGATPMQFPSSLTKLALHITGGFQYRPDLAEYLLLAVERCLASQLEELELSLFNFEQPRWTIIDGKWVPDPSEPPITNTTIDWSFLRSFQRLKIFTMHRRRILSAPPSLALPTASRLIPCCGQLPTLTALDLSMESNEIDYPLSDLAHLTQPQLRIATLPFEKNRAMLESLHRVQPLIEEFLHSSDSDFDLPVIVSLFTHVKKLIFWSESMEDEDTAVTALTQAKSLTYIAFIFWYPAKIESYVRLAQSPDLINLTHLCVEPLAPIELIVQGAQLGTQPLIDRVTRIDVKEANAVLTLENMQLFRQFTSLTHLELLSQTSNCKEPYLTFYDQFNDPTLLPRLTFLRVHEYRPHGNQYFSIEYDHCKSVNQCTISSANFDDNTTITELKKSIRYEHDPTAVAMVVKNTPPASRLVGVELNPGPISSTSITPATLFTDGLASIFAYCDNRDWLHSSRVSQYWFSVASSCSRSIVRYIAAKNRDDLKEYCWSGHEIEHDQKQQQQQQQQQLQQYQQPIPNTHWSLGGFQFRPISPHDAGDANISGSILDSPFQHLVVILARCLSEQLEEFELNLFNFERSRSPDPIEPPPTNITIDWTPLRSFQQLKKMTLIRDKIQLGIWNTLPLQPSASRFLPCCGALSHLTELNLDVDLNDPDYTIDDLVHLTCPQLHICKVPFQMNRAVVESLHCVQPLIEEFIFTESGSGFDLPAIVALFTHVKRFVFNGTLPTEWREEEAIAALSQAKSLTRLDLFKWFPIQPESYIQLAQSTHLAQLNHLYIQSLDPLRFIMQGAKLGTQPLIDRLTQVTVMEGTNVLTEENMLLFGEFTSLTHLQLDCYQSDRQESYLLFYNRFNDPTFLPRLTFVQVNEERFESGCQLYFSIDYNYSKGINRCIISNTNKDGVTTTELRKRIRYEHDPAVVKNAPPAARLVGIELNPGPSASAASTLFNDGFRLIYSYMTNIEWHHSALVSHHWFKAAASSSSNRRMTYKHHDITKEEMKAANKAIKEQEKKKSKTIAIPSVSLWSLRHHIREVACGRVTWHTILSQCAIAPQIESLKIARLIADPPSGFLSRSMKPRTDMQLPLTLTSLSLSYVCLLQAEHMEEQLVLDLISRCRNLVLLTYSLSMGTAIRSPTSGRVNYSCWSQLIQLTSLTIFVNSSSQLTEESFWSCVYAGHWKNLTYLDVTQMSFHLPSALAASSSPSAPSPLPTLPQLHTLIGPILFSATTLHELHSIMPNLTCLESRDRFNASIHVDSLTMFKKLSDISFDTQPRVGDSREQITQQDEPIAITLSRCTSLTRIQFATWSFRTPQCWSPLSVGLPKLIHLDFGFLDHSPLPEWQHLAIAGSLWSRIRRLTLTSCTRLSSTLFTDQLPQLTSLTHLTIAHCLPAGVDSDLLPQRFASSSYCPQLEIVTIRTRVFLLEFDARQRRGVYSLNDRWSSLTEEEYPQLNRPFPKLP